MQNKNEAMQRLRNIEGHVRGVERMLENDAYCIDVIRQIQAVQAALNKVNALVLEGHLSSCVVDAIQGDDPHQREIALGEITEVFSAAINSK
jgi:DNA-binding FrmR family transcriptional regulator